MTENNNTDFNGSVSASAPSQSEERISPFKQKYSAAKIIAIAVSSVAITVFSVFLLNVSNSLPSGSTALSNNTVNINIDDRVSEIETFRNDQTDYISLETLSRLFGYNYSVSENQVTITTESHIFAVRPYVKVVNITNLADDSTSIFQLSEPPVIENSVMYVTIDAVQEIFKDKTISYNAETHTVVINTETDTNQ